VQTIFGFLFALGVLITLHEFGHYGVGRLCGVRVLRFSLGFGKPLLKWQAAEGTTEWVLAPIPLGGYVNFFGDGPLEVPQTERHLAFKHKPLWQRAAIVAAGPIVNLLLAVCLYAAVSLLGTQEIAPVLGEPPAQSTAAAAGVRDGDKVTGLIVADIEKPVMSLPDLRWQLIRAAAAEEPVRLVVSRSGGSKELSFALDSNKANFDDAWFRQLGLRLPDTAAVIGAVLAGGAAEQGGLRSGDEITSVDGVPLKFASEFRARVRESAGKSLELGVTRLGRVESIKVTPRAVKEGSGPAIGLVGAAVGLPPEMVQVQRGVFDSLVHGVEQTWSMSTLTLRMLGKMLTGQASLKQISGPLTIADYAGKSVAVGLTAYLLFLAAISVSLGVLNLLPIPLLDGGRLLYYAAEAALRRPIPEAWEALGQRIGLAALAGLMMIAFFNDFSRYVVN
jgi:regulator of sigma E protease